ncbi:hypothetical protein D3C85_1745150 [compost metagenome]
MEFAEKIEEAGPSVGFVLDVLCQVALLDCHGALDVLVQINEGFIGGQNIPTTRFSAHNHDTFCRLLKLRRRTRKKQA